MQFIDQVRNIFKEYNNDLQEQARYVHFNWMARGEPLSNINIIDFADYILLDLARIATDRGLYPKFNISTIMPKDCDRKLTDIFRFMTPTIYYSIYSLDKDFRRKWLPNAMNPIEALEQLKDYQKLSKKIVKFHGAFIAGENDDTHEVRDMCQVIKTYVPHCEFNIVRYNPYSQEQGRETGEGWLSYIQEIISEYMPCKIIPRVGMDVKASCGMFVE